MNFVERFRISLLDFHSTNFGVGRLRTAFAFAIASVLSCVQLGLLFQWYSQVSSTPLLEISLWHLGSTVALHWLVNAVAALTSLSTKSGFKEKAISVAILVCFIEFICFYFPAYLFFPRSLEDASLLFFCMDVGFVTVSAVQAVRVCGWKLESFFVAAAVAILLLSAEIRLWLPAEYSTTTYAWTSYFPLLAVGVFAVIAVKTKANIPAWCLMFGAWSIVDFLS